MLLMKNGALKWLGLQPSLKAICTELTSIAQVSPAAATVLTTLTEARTPKIPNSRFLYYRYQRASCQAVPRLISTPEMNERSEINRQSRGADQSFARST
jgi:hypothetical protein